VRAPLSLLAFALGLLLMPGSFAQEDAPAQGACQAPVLALPQTPKTFEPGASFNLPFAIENPNDASVELVRADVKVTTPDGWTAIPARRELTLGPRDAEQNVLAITAPSRGTGAAAGNITLSVEFVCVTGIVQRSSLPAQHVLQVSIRSFQAPWPVVLGAFAILAVGVVILGLRRLRRGVAISPTQRERPIVPGKSAKFTFIVENRRGKPARYHLLPAGIPEGWSIHLALEEVELEPGEEKTLWAILKAPPTAAPMADVPFTLRLVGAGAGDGAAAEMVARVVSPE
jgi:hypothetical protein